MAFSLNQARKIGEELDLDWSDFSVSDFLRGMEVELEHKDVTKGDPLLTAKIALAHLKELPDYYDRLQKMETQARRDEAGAKKYARTLL